MVGKRLRMGVVAAAVLTAVGASSVALATDGGPVNGVAPAGASAAESAVGCARQFDAAQRVDMESFRDFDEQRFRDIHHEKALTVFPNGVTRFGRDKVMEALKPHFTNKNATWTWTELNRVVDGCRTAHILYDTTYAIPSQGYSQRALVGVTYTREHGKWLALADQNTAMKA